MTHNAPIFQYTYATGNGKSFVAAAGAVLTTLVTVPIAVALGLSSTERGELLPALFGFGLSGFMVLGTVKLVFDHVFPKAWSLVVSGDSLIWSLPTESKQLPLEMIAELYVRDSWDSPRLSITTRDGKKIWINPNCLGRLDELTVLVRSQYPHVHVVYAGSAKKLSKLVRASAPPSGAFAGYGQPCGTRRTNAFAKFL